MIPNFISKKGPLFKEKIFITRPNLPASAKLLPKIDEMIRKRWVTNFGDFHNELERRIKDALQVKYAVLCCNGTMGLFLLLKALKLRGRVITSPFTFPATVHAIYMAGLEPVFCDIDTDDYMLSAEKVERHIESDVSAVLSVNVFGNISDVESLDRISAKHRIPIIYDSAHAFYSSYKGKPAGGFGRAEMFSFHAAKLFTTLEGGAITTNDEALFRRLKLLINFGIKDEEHVIDVGLNAKMSEISAIFGLLSLANVEEVIDNLTGLKEIYKQRLAQIPGIKFQKIREGCVINNQYMAIEIIPEEFGLDRDALHSVLKEDNVIVRKYFFPAAHQYDCYKDMPFAKNAELPNTEKVSGRIICLPIYHDLKKDDITKICDLIESTYRYRDEISDRLRQGLSRVSPA